MPLTVSPFSEARRLLDQEVHSEDNYNYTRFLCDTWQFPWETPHDESHTQATNTRDDKPNPPGTNP
jgi:hypothetical protein